MILPGPRTSSSACDRAASGADEDARAPSAAEFVQRVIGLPWRENGYGPDAYDCWGLARACQREVFGRSLPIVDYPATLRAIVRTMNDHTVRDAWPEVKLPAHGDIVTMTAALHPHHVGTWLQLEGGCILHATRREGVMCSSLHHIRLEGFRGLRFHRFLGTRPSPSAPDAARPIADADVRAPGEKK